MACITNLVPRISGSGGIGTDLKPWGSGYFNSLWVTGADGAFCQVSCSGGGGGAGNPGGADTQVQFNQGGVFGGEPHLIYNYSSNYLSGVSGIFDYLTGNTGHFRNEVRIGTGDRTALTVDNKGNVGIGFSGHSGVSGESGSGYYPLQAQLHVSGSTIISGSAFLYLDYNALPKSDPSEKGRCWIDAGNNLKVSAG